MNFASGQRFVVLGRNSLKPFELLSKDLYKISVIGLSSTFVILFAILSLQGLNTHHMWASRLWMRPAMTLPFTFYRQGLLLLRPCFVSDIKTKWFSSPSEKILIMMQAFRSQPGFQPRCDPSAFLFRCRLCFHLLYKLLFWRTQKADSKTRSNFDLIFNFVARVLITMVWWQLQRDGEGATYCDP